jgi:hypothetical protein
VLDTTRTVNVPRGAKLLVAWSLNEDVAGAPVVDAASGVDVEGPALVRADGDALVLEQGAAVADARARRELRTPVVRTIGADASWRVEVRGGMTSIAVLRGEVSVSSGDVTRRLRAGEHVEIASSTPPRTAANPEPPSLQVPTGTVDMQRVLGDLVDAEDDERAFDAASSLVDAARAPRERAAIWRRYLGRNRPSPHADLAMADLANAFLDLGAFVDARVVVGALTSRPPLAPSPQARAVEHNVDRARGRLLSHDASECLAHDLRAVCPRDPAAGPER